MQCTLPKIVLQLTVISALLDENAPLPLPELVIDKVPPLSVFTSQLQPPQVRLSTLALIAVPAAYVDLAWTVDSEQVMFLNVVVSVEVPELTMWMVLPVLRTVPSGLVSAVADAVPTPMSAIRTTAAAAAKPRIFGGFIFSPMRGT